MPYIANARQPVPFTFQNPFTYPANARQPFTYIHRIRSHILRHIRTHLHIMQAESIYISCVLSKSVYSIMHRTHSLIQVVRVRSLNAQNPFTYNNVKTLGTTPARQPVIYDHRSPFTYQKVRHKNLILEINNNLILEIFR